MRESIGQVRDWWCHGGECRLLGLDRSFLMIVERGGWAPVGCTIGHCCGYASR